MTVQIKRKVLITSEVTMVALNRYQIKFKGPIDRDMSFPCISTVLMGLS